jgi:hypothetical protein
MDTPDQVEAVAAVLRRAFEVVEESGEYANRGTSRLVRRYMDLRLRTDAAAPCGIVPMTVAAVRDLLAEVQAVTADDTADRTYALESVERRLSALLYLLDPAGGAA